MKQDDGGPAFPHTVNAADGTPIAHLGMTLRDYFAGQALIGLLAMPDIDHDDRSMQDVINTAFHYADGMLEKRLKETKDAATDDGNRS